MKTSSTSVYRSTAKPDYDQTLKVEGTKIQCYSPKKMQELYPNGGYTVLGEAKGKNKKPRVAVLNVWRSRFIVSALEANNKNIFRKAGFVCVGPDEYVVILKNRFAFLIWLVSLLAGVGLASALLLAALSKKDPVVIDPDHPLPTEDPYAQTIPADEDAGDKAVSEEGGGSVSMVYMLEASANLSSGEIEIYFRNPSTSNHDVKLVMYVLAGGEEYPIGQSGLVTAGSELRTLELIEDAAKLKEGTYDGLFRLYCYDSLTGEKALVEPEIADLVITVTK